MSKSLACDKANAAFSPTVVVSGGGPAGLLAAILLGRAGVSTIVIERGPEADQWSSKSYSIVLSDRGLGALNAVGVSVLDAVKESGMERRNVFIWDAEGNMKTVPKSSVGIGISRPLLIECLETIAVREASVKIKRGTGVSAVKDINAKATTLQTTTASPSSSSDMLQVVLEDGSMLLASHVIGADGKWSQVRQSCLELECQARVKVEPTFGVQMMVSESSVPDGWPIDGTHVLRPSPSSGETFYIIAAPLPTGELSVTMVCYDTTVEQHPWLEPPQEYQNRAGSGFGCCWEDEYSAKPKQAQGSSDSAHVDLVDNLRKLFEKEMPFFLSAIGRDALDTARINRRVSWLEMTAVPLPASLSTCDGNDESDSCNNDEKLDDIDPEQQQQGVGMISYATGNGRVALIGDSAHAMIPTIGDGCNMALESAVKLLAPLLFAVSDEKGEVASSSSTTIPDTVELLSEAFRDYGRSRPKEAQPIQMKSAALSSGFGGNKGKR